MIDVSLLNTTASACRAECINFYKSFFCKLMESVFFVCLYMFSPRFFFSEKCNLNKLVILDY